MKSLIISLLFAQMVILSCKDGKSSSDDIGDFIDSLRRAGAIDSMTKGVIRDALMDTAGLYLSPVKVSKASLYKENYSNYKNISLTYKNVSSKRIEAIKFKWYGVDAFGEPADMGTSFVDGFGSGMDDDPLGVARTKTSSWSILSSNGKKVILAWAYEVAFEDGSKWKLK